ncbi:MAG: hypothetical protein ACI4TB_04030, partial [Lachnospiraceae bacterium]
MNIFEIIQLKKKELAKLLTLSLGGLIFFLMHWETSPRYITNFVPVILIMAIGGLKEMEALMEKVWCKFGSKV